MLSERKLKIIQAYADVARPVIRRTFREDSCIGSTRITIDVLKRFGIAAAPHSVFMEVGNRQYLECREREGTCSSQEQLIRWGDQYGAYINQVGQPNPGGWSGHVVAIVKDQVLIDAAIDQANRPKWGIIFPDVLVAESHREFLKGHALVFASPNGSWVRYWSAPGVRSYTHSRDWRLRERTQDIVTETAQRIGERI